jgi:small-conductance mechanosensitive channel
MFFLKKLSLSLISIVVCSAFLGMWYFLYGGEEFLKSLIPNFDFSNFFSSLLIIALLIVIYSVWAKIIKSSVFKGKGTPGEVTMLQGVFRFVIIAFILLIFISTWVSFGTMGTLFLTFGGMILGWGLQAPISGLAAWLMISIARPFRVGDRVQLPAQGLVGDVINISPLYTTLNQVGGSVGSEEPADRTILIPNAMLFGALVINYTPKHQEDLIKSHKKSDGKHTDQSAYMLDEFVCRLSFDSDWDEAEKILIGIAKEVTADIIAQTKQEPYIRADFGDWYGVFMRLRFLTDAVERPRIIYEISKRIFKEFQNNKKVDFAIPYIYSNRKGSSWSPPTSIEKLDHPVAIDQLPPMDRVPSIAFMSNSAPKILTGKMEDIPPMNMNSELGLKFMSSRVFPDK